MIEPILEVKDLRVSFSTDDGILKAVRGIDFSLAKGETLALVGESGSGKSVSVKSIMGLLPGNARVESGEILFGNIDILKLSEKALCKIRGSGIAMIFQDPMSSLDPIVKVGYQITEAIRISGKKRNKPIGRKAANKRAMELMSEVGIKDPERKFFQYPFEFSGGMRQRIVIAIALAADPEILICDEPTTALDVTVQAQILELIEKLKRERGLSVIFITHDLGVVANVADRVAVMYAGKIVEVGTSHEIFYLPAHPYTWALLSVVPDLDTKTLPKAIPGSVPSMISPPVGDVFADRSDYAMKIDFIKEPPMFKITDTHYAATWLLHPFAPDAKPPGIIKERAERIKNWRKEYE